MNAITGGKQSNKPQSGLGGLASSFLGGQNHGSGSHGNTGQGTNSGGSGIAGQLLGSFLGGSTPHNQQAQASSGQFTGSSTGSQGHQQGQHSGIMGMASSFLGGHHGSSVRACLSRSTALVL